MLSAALAFAAPASADDFNATVVAGHPPIFLWVKTLTETFIPATQKALEGTGHTLTFTEAYGGTLAKVGGELEAMEDGLAQIGIVSSLFEPSLLSLQNVSYATPFGSPDVDVVFDAVDEMHEEIPDMRKLWEDHDLEYLGGGFGLEDYLLMTNFPVTSLADLEGRKINAPGPAVNWLKDTGAVGVSGNLTTYYNDLQTGVTEGVIVFPTAAAPAKLHEQAKYVTRTHFGAQYAGAIVAKKSWFEELPEEVQSAIRTGVEEFAKAYRAGLDQRVTAAFEAMEAGGAEISELPDEERVKWANALPNLPMDWAKNLDGQGLAGTEVVKTYLDKLRAAGTELPREWDKE
ncbi:MAG: C4-dicarboxylate TRAP transporter substrate-binding protein [Rhizobiaceae bacterium]|nr:C4-dicarboxylate TRAP transporter substrate-binding protein [Rhizobiaceae bacterium]MCV0406987.1 C4-dicarboxylate TRAP transporter substrate-binding protein [Rhizobiaceae bacterium]